MASKLIVNEIEHTDGSGTAVTMAKATIADATLTSATITAGTIPAAGITGVLPVGVTGGSGLDAVPAPAATAGQPIQTKTNEIENLSAHIRPNGTDTNVLSIDFTPISSSSTIIGVYSIGNVNTWAQSFIVLQIRYNNTNVKNGDHGKQLLSISGDLYTQLGAQVVFPSWSGERTIWLVAVGATNNVLVHSGSYISLSLTEIAG